MPYPDKPNNDIVIKNSDGTTTSLYDAYGLIMLDGYTLSPPEPKTNYIDIPGGNGTIDLTETLNGDTVYNDRTQSFSFLKVDEEDPLNFEPFKTTLMKFFHGKKFDFQITMDPDYTYKGRFKLTDASFGVYSNFGCAMAFDVEVTADPYKYKENETYVVNAYGGYYRAFECGRKHVIPRIQCSKKLDLIFKGKKYSVDAGTWRINDIVFQEDEDNAIYFSTAEVFKIKWSEIIGEDGNGQLFRFEPTDEPIGSSIKFLNSKRLYQWMLSGTGSDAESSEGDLVTYARWGDVNKPTVTWQQKRTSVKVHDIDENRRELETTHEEPIEGWKGDMSEYIKEGQELARWRDLYYKSAENSSGDDLVYIDYEIGDL